jgi:site-specific recombinase XerD
LDKAEEQFIKKCKIRCCKGTTKNYRLSIMTFRKFYVGRLDELTADDIDDYIIWLQEEKDIKTTTINNRLRDLRVFLNWCHKRGYIEKIKVQLLKNYEVDIIPLEVEQLKEIYDACLSRKSFCRYRDYMIMRVLEETGIRISECLNLKINDVNLDKQTIIIKNTKNRENRPVYFTQAARTELKKYLELRQQFLYNKNLAATSFFVSQSGGKLATRTIQERIKNYGDLAGIPVRVSPHTFRHTFARNFLINGGDMVVLQELLGHSSFDMVRRYIRLFGRDKQNQYNAVMAKYTRQKRKLS